MCEVNFYWEVELGHVGQLVWLARSFSGNFLHLGTILHQSRDFRL